ncbi:MAG: right-handed parallel beta-helix repeat-containing protein [Actinobacteria bacterium]|nr:right-handed parallel beta-helix repeat-containing protein [Actinomycetota bacterium]
MALATALALLLLGTAFTAPVSAAHVACGQVITESTTLHSDVGPCPGDGLIVAADGVVLDLNGHEVRGVNGAEETAGVVLRRVSGVTVTNGTVTGFDAGVVVGAGGANVVRGMTVVDNVGNSLACNLGDGIAVFNSQQNLITDNTVARNGPFSGISLVGPSTGNNVKANQVRDNNLPTVYCGNSRQDMGIRLEGPGASGNMVDANVVERNGLAGIAVHSTVRGEPTNDANTISDNTVAHNGVGVGGYGIAMLPNGPLGPVVRSSGNTVRGNTVVANTTDGIHVPRGSTDNALVANQGSGNVRYDGADLNDQCDDNSWVRNAFVTVSQPCVAGKQGPKPKQQQGDETVTVTTRAMPDLP